MREYFTEAVVLGLKPVGLSDRIVNLYTKDFGRLEAKVVAARKITSKLSPHLEEGNLIEARLIEKNRFILADVVLKKRFGKNLAVFEILFLLKSLLPELVSDLRLWHGLVQGLQKENLDKKIFLKFLGYNTVFAKCENCESSEIGHFSTIDQTFLCRGCFEKLPSHQFKAISI
jgi:recombinational DNA repair protein (RecF pathway)